MCMVVRGVGLLGGSGRSGLFLISYVSVLLRIPLSNRICSGPSFLRVTTSVRGVLVSLGAQHRKEITHIAGHPISDHRLTMWKKKHDKPSPEFDKTLKGGER